MRALRLVGMAAQAESRRLKIQAGAKVSGLVYWVVAGVFGLTAYVLLHILLYNAVWHWLGPIWAAAIVLLIDLVLAGAMAFLATRSSHSQAEVEARAVRDVALAGAAEELFLGVAKRSAPLAVLGGIGLTLLRRR
ncbi:hypothetical protein [Roseomonas sp. BN140053]|uniref:hypothetical protein n=1 Tax=Roseomonas sp. BN140053 TaxID=3391898 RepID=UPI0039EA06AC